MSDETLEREENNKAHIKGKIETGFICIYKTDGERFYRTRVRVARYSGKEDLIPLVVSEKLIEKEIVQTSVSEKWIEATGQFKSYNRTGDDGHNHLDLFLFATEINIYEKQLENENSIYLDGYICKPPLFRVTPLGKEIADVMIAVNRVDGKSDYIPCILWKRAAWRISNEFGVGDRVELEGRVQSRYYLKKSSTNPEEREIRIAYEISVKKCERVKLI